MKIILDPGCQPKVGILDLYLAMFMVGLSVDVCESVVGHADVLWQKAGPIEMPFGMWGGVGHSHHVLDVCPDPPGEGAILG